MIQNVMVELNILRESRSLMKMMKAQKLKTMPQSSLDKVIKFQRLWRAKCAAREKNGNVLFAINKEEMECVDDLIPCRYVVSVKRGEESRTFKVNMKLINKPDMKHQEHNFDWDLS